MRLLAGIVLLFNLVVPRAVAETWVDVCADPEARFYVDVDSISIVKNNLRVTKRGVYTRVLTENLGGKPTVFKETRGLSKSIASVVRQKKGQPKLPLSQSRPSVASRPGAAAQLRGSSSGLTKRISEFGPVPISWMITSRRAHA